MKNNQNWLKSEERKGGKKKKNKKKTTEQHQRESQSMTWTQLLTEPSSRQHRIQSSFIHWRHCLRYYSLYLEGKRGLSQPWLCPSFIVGKAYWLHVVNMHEYCSASTYLFSLYIKAPYTKQRQALLWWQLGKSLLFSLSDSSSWPSHLWHKSNSLKNFNKLSLITDNEGRFTKLCYISYHHRKVNWIVWNRTVFEILFDRVLSMGQIKLFDI